MYSIYSTIKSQHILANYAGMSTILKRAYCSAERIVSFLAVAVTIAGSAKLCPHTEEEEEKIFA